MRRYRFPPLIERDLAAALEEPTVEATPAELEEWATTGNVPASLATRLDAAGQGGA